MSAVNFEPNPSEIRRHTSVQMFYFHQSEDALRRAVKASGCPRTTSNPKTFLFRSCLFIRDLPETVI